MKKHDPVMAVCPECGSRLLLEEGSVTYPGVCFRTYLCGAVYHDGDRRKTTEVCSEIARLRAERVDAARSGYLAGHNDTVEGQYGDPGDIAEEICEEIDSE